MSNNYKFETLKVDGNEAVSKLLEMRKEFADSGKYPFIIGNEFNLQNITPNVLSGKFDPQETLEKAEKLDVSDWFAERKKEWDYSEILGKYFPPGMSARELGMDYDLRMLGHKDILKNRPYAEVFVGTVEIEESWMLPAYLDFGGWNDCPFPEIHCAVMKYWQEKFGAEIISLTGDVIECKVENPPLSDEDVVSLATEQYLYCTDIVDQGFRKIAALAQDLYNSDYWYFWWD